MSVFIVMSLLVGVTALSIVQGHVNERRRTLQANLHQQELEQLKMLCMEVLDYEYVESHGTTLKLLKIKGE